MPKITVIAWEEVRRCEPLRIEAERTENGWKVLSKFSWESVWYPIEKELEGGYFDRAEREWLRLISG